MARAKYGKKNEEQKLGLLLP